MKKIRIDALDIAYTDSGSGRPLLLLHAFPLNRTMWSDQVSELSSRFRLIAPDLRGFGESDSPQGPYLMEQMASDAFGLLKALSIEKAVIVGVSMGGYVAFAFYRNYPGAVAGLVLCATRASADTPEARDQRLKTAAKAERFGANAVLDDILPKLVGAQTASLAPDLLSRIRSIAETTPAATLAAALRGMAERRDSMDLLPRIACPSLFIAGNDDVIVPSSEVESMHRLTPDSAFRLIDSSGHLVNLESPTVFSSAVAEFMYLIETKSLW